MTTTATTTTCTDAPRNETESDTRPEFMNLLVQFMQEGYEDPDRFDRIPQGAVLIILPSDDPELAAQEQAKAEALAAQGRTVHIETIGPRRPAPPPWWRGERVPGKLFAGLPYAESLFDEPEPMVVFDPSRDLLLVSERHGPQQGLAWPLRDSLSVLVDIEVNSAFAFIVSDFVTQAIPQRPQLAFLLALAQVRSLHQDDVGDFELPPIREAAVTPPARPDVLSPKDRDRLIEAFRDLTGEATVTVTRTQFFE